MTMLGWHESRADVTDEGFVHHPFYVGRDGATYYWYFGGNPAEIHKPFASSQEAYDDAMNQ